MRFPSLRLVLPVVLLVLSVAAPLAAQDTTSRGVRIGLTYDPGSKPGVAVLPVAGATGDSVRAIVQRDFDFGDRVNPIVLDATTASEASRASGPNWPLLARLGAAAAVQITPTASGFHLAVYNVATKQTALIRDYATSATPQSRAWRAALHGISDDLEEAFTSVRGVASTRILFERGKRIWVVDSDGEGALPVSEVGTPISPSWSPSGRTIAYSTLLPASISVLDLSTGRARQLVSGAGVYISPIFSPDGANVIYAHGVDAGVDLYTIPLSGGAPRRLSVGRGSDNVSPSFSPDGRRIAFMSGRAGHPEIYTMDADGTNVDLLTPLDIGEKAYRASPDWSPDGRLVAFQSQMGSTFQVLTINLRDRSLRQLTSDGRNEDPSWAPDGRHLTFVSNRTGVRQLWVLDVETGRSRQLTRGAPVRLPAWSPRLSAE
jgi:TolB protein